MLHIHLVPETPPAGPSWACAEIRLLRPYGHPSLADRAVVSAGKRLPTGRLDVVVLQRGGPADAGLDDVVEMVRQVRRRGARLVYDIDDDLLTEHPSATVERGVAPQRPRIRFLAREADLVIASTAVLAERLQRLNPNVRVWRNALDERLVAAQESERGEGADLGYAGTLSHLEDLLSIIEPLQNGLAGLAEPAAIEVCGVDRRGAAAELLAGFGKVALAQTAPYADFMRGFQQRAPWKAGIAPLAPNAFNAGKSDIKFLDYALFGVAGVYPRGEVYAEVRHEETGLLAGPEDWGDMVRRLIEDPDLRRRIRTNARDHLMQDRTLARRAPELLDIVEANL